MTTSEERISELERLYSNAMQVVAAQDDELKGLRTIKAELASLKEQFGEVDQRAFTAKVHADRASGICDELRTEVIRLQETLRSYGVSEPLKEEK